MMENFPMRASWRARGKSRVERPESAWIGWISIAAARTWPALAATSISRQTFYRWRRRYDPHNLATLEPHSHRPHRRRQPTWSSRLADRVLALRLRYPRWGRTSSPSCCASSRDRVGLANRIADAHLQLESLRAGAYRLQQHPSRIGQLSLRCVSRF
jgi:hypothetical protein